MSNGIPPPRGPETPPPPPPRVEVAPQVRPEVATLLRRAWAIAIDSLVWLGIAVPINLEHSFLDPGTGFHPAVTLRLNTASLSLSGLPLLISMALWLAYMAVMEATIGASIGKVLTGLRVVRREDGRISPLAAIVRTVTRLIDVLPGLYLLGGIVAIKSEDRQRIGDRLAGTVVVRAPSVARQASAPVPEEAHAMTQPGRRAIAAMSVGLALIVLVLSGYVWLGRSTPGTVDLNGIRFTYPSDWRRVDAVIIEAANPPAFRRQFGLDPYNYVAVAGYQLRVEVTAENESRVLAGFSSLLRSLPDSGQGTLVDGPMTTRVAGIPAVSFSLMYDLPGGIEERFDGIALFHHGIEYLMSCEYTPDRAEEIRAGCDQAIASLHVD